PPRERSAAADSRSAVWALDRARNKRVSRYKSSQNRPLRRELPRPFVSACRKRNSVEKSPPSRLSCLLCIRRSSNVSDARHSTYPLTQTASLRREASMARSGDPKKKPKGGFTRRDFLGGAGLALSTPLVAGRAAAE